MKNYFIEFTNSSKKDLNRIWFFNAKDSREKANKITEEIQKFCYEYFSVFPKMGRKREKLKKGIYSFSHNHYNIFYSILNKTVYIERIFQEREDYSNTF